MTVTVCNSCAFDTCPVATIYRRPLALVTKQFGAWTHAPSLALELNPEAQPGNPPALPQGAFLLYQGFPHRLHYWVSAFSLPGSQD